MAYENRNTYLPTIYWIHENKLYRGFFEYEEDIVDSPRDWDNLGTMVCFHPHYSLGDVQLKRGESYAEHIDRDKVFVMLNLNLYDHSGITMYTGSQNTCNWDTSSVGFIYVYKDNEEVLDYMKTHTEEETFTWARNLLEAEVRVYDSYLRGEVYYIVSEYFDVDTGEWEFEDGIGNIYLTSNTYAEEQKLATAELIGNFSGKCKLLEEDTVLKAIENGELDTLYGQKMLFEKEA